MATVDGKRMGWRCALLIYENNGVVGTFRSSDALADG